MLDELVDRFGAPPRAVDNLLQIIRIKWLAAALKLEQIQQLKQYVHLRFARDPGLTGEKLMEIAAASPYPLAFGTSGSGNLECKVRLRTVGQEEILKAVRKVLSTFSDIASRTTP